MHKWATLILIALLILFGAIVPIKTYTRYSCYIADVPNRLNLIEGENIEDVDNKLASHKSGPNEGACLEREVKVKLYVL